MITSSQKSYGLLDDGILYTVRRAGQGRAKQGRAEGRPGQGRAGQRLEGEQSRAVLPRQG